MGSFDVRQGPTQNLRNRAAALFPKEFELNNPGPLPHGQMEINGIRFPIDPQGISIYEENQNHAFQTLRNRESTKVRSGHGRISITVRAIFTGVSRGIGKDNDGGNSLATINSTLMPILYSLKKMPLCFIDNELIRRSLPVVSGQDADGNLIGEPIGAFIKMVNIGTVPGLPHAISAEFQLVWYNHRPFAPRIRFRKTWMDEQGKVLELRNAYEESNLKLASRPAVQATQGTKNNPPAGADIAKGHPGRLAFIQNYGHPSVAFNATAYHSATDTIHEARPLLEYLWPYLYESSNPAVSGNQQVFDIGKLPPFEMQSFSRDFGFGFTVMRQPDKKVLDYILSQTGLDRDSNDQKKLTQAKRQQTGKFGSLSPTPRTGPMTRAEVAEYAKELGVHPDLLLSAIILYTETGLAAIDTELDLVVHSLLNNALRTGGDMWNYAVGARKVTGIQGKGKEFRRYGSSKIPQGADLIKAIDIVKRVLQERASNGNTFQNVTNFVHTGSQNASHKRSVKALEDWTVEYAKWQACTASAGASGYGLNFNCKKPPPPPKIARSADAVDKSWSQTMNRLTVPGLPATRIMAYGRNTNLLGQAAVRDHAEGLLRGTPPQRQVSIAQVFKVNLKDVVDVIASNLDLLAAPHAPNGVHVDAVQAEIDADPTINGREEIQAILNLAREGWTLLINDITNKPVLTNDVSIDVYENAANVIPLSINVGFGTNLAMMPLEGHRFPTVQYVGGQHTAATVSFRVEGEDGRRFVSEFKALVNSDEEAAIHFREFSKRRGITIRNPMLNSLGIKVVFLEDMSVDTVPGSPEGLNVTMRLIDATLNESLPALLLGKDEVSLEDILREALKLLFDKEWVEFKFSNNFQVYGINELDVNFTDRGIRDITPGIFDNTAEASTRRRFNNFEKSYGLQNFDAALTKVLAEYDRRKKAGEFSHTILDDISSRAGTPEGDVAYILSLLRTSTVVTDPNSKVREGRLFVVPGKIQIGVTKKAIQSGVERDIQRLVDYIEGKISSENFRYRPRIDVRDFPKMSKSLTGLGLQPLSSYVGYGGLQIDSDVLVPGMAAAGMLGTDQEPGLIQSAGFRALFTNITSRLIAQLGIAENGKQPKDPDFATLAARMGDMLEFNPGHVAYPDLMLPPNPITGLVADTLPDFFLYNESDVKLSNSNLAKLIFGQDTATLPKKRGLKIGKYAIQNGLRGIQDVYGASDNPLSGDGIRPAHEGKDGVYLDFNEGKHETLSKKKGKKFVQDRLPPQISGGLLSNPEERPVTVETNIAARFGASQDGVNLSKPQNKKYSRDRALGFHLQNSIYRDEYSNSDQPNNLNRLSHTFSQSEYERVFEEFETNYSSEHYAVRRSFPTFKVMFIEENSDVSSSDNPLLAKLTKTYALDDFYGVNSIKEIRIVKNKDMAADVCVIQVLDLDGVLYNRKYLPPNDYFGSRKTKSAEERNPFLDTIIKEGMKVVVKFGYSNDPQALETMFVGQIVNWEGSHVVEIICQSYGSELVSQRFGTDPSENADFWNVTTGDLLHDLLDREEVRHFGRWKLSDVSLTGKLFGVEKLRPDGKVKKVYTWKPSVVDDNLFIPDTNTYASTWARVWGDLEYVFFDTTIWDCFKEMELRHPGYIAYPVPYGSGSDARMTMFFGHPSMPYLARPAQDIDEIEGEIAGNNINTVRMREIISKVGSVFRSNSAGSQEEFAAGLSALDFATRAKGYSLEELARLTSTSVEDLRIAAPSARSRLNKLRALLTKKEQEALPADTVYAKKQSRVFDSIASDKFWAATQYFQDGRIRPFRNYELVTSMHDILLNNIRADHRGTFNSVELRYSDSDVDFAGFAQGSDVETITVNADDNIKDHHIRRTIENWPNCTTGDLARRYASQLLANSLKETYKGELLILGRPQLKPYDVIWLYDNYSDMAGPIEVFEVVHTISSETGFITEVVPHMIVTVKEEVTTLMVDAIGAFFTEHLKEFTNGALIGLGGFGAGALTVANFSGRAAGLTAGLSFGMPVAVATNEALSGGAVNPSPPSDKRLGTGSGVVAGFGLGALWAVNPIIPCAAGIVAGALLYKLLKYNSTREPIIVTPLIKQGKPYVTGLEGMESDGLLVTDLLSSNKEVSDKAFEAFIGRKWKYFSDGIDDAADVLKAGWANWMAQP